MSEDTDEAGADDSGPDGEDAERPALDADAMEARLEEAAEALEAAETEADLDAVVEQLDAVETALEAADLPEPDDEDEESPEDRIEGRLSELRDDLEGARGPYIEDVTAVLAPTSSVPRASARRERSPTPSGPRTARRLRLLPSGHSSRR